MRRLDLRRIVGRKESFAAAATFTRNFTTAQTQQSIADRKQKHVQQKYPELNDSLIYSCMSSIPNAESNTSHAEAHLSGMSSWNHANLTTTGRAFACARPPFLLMQLTNGCMRRMHDCYFMINRWAFMKYLQSNI